jgi:VIT1/CCC1 family predicted Fe2+/Mn2+ transporter
MSTTAQAPASGWYPDPEHEGTQRFWNGSEWTESRAPLKQAERTPGAGSYVVAVLLPIVGAILSIIQFARGNSGHAGALLLTSIVAGFLWIIVLGSIEAASYDACIQDADTLAEMGRC